MALFGTAVFMDIALPPLLSHAPETIRVMAWIILSLLSVSTFVAMCFMLDVFYPFRHFRHVLYNEEDKEVTIILGYGIGNHLSIAFLFSTLLDVVMLFPGLLLTKWWKIPFLEVADSSRSHRYEWYTRFKYDLSDYPRDKWGYYQITSSQNAYGVSSHVKGVNDWHHESETAKEVVGRLVHS